MTGEADFWVSSGHHLVDRSEGGGLVVTDAFLSAYLARPELMPPDEACPVERGLHAELLANPRMLVAQEALALVADADARENFALFLAFRDRLLIHPTLESAWLSLARHGAGNTPPLFLQHLTHLIARNAFDDVADARVLRAAECFWRPQRVTFHEGAVLLADEETIAGHEHARTHSPLMSMLGGPAVSELEILTDENTQSYHGRSDAYDLVYDLTHPDRGRQALGEAMAILTRHLLGFSPDYHPVEALDEARVTWFLSLDSDGTTFGNRIWAGEALEEAERGRVLALFSFTLPDHPRIMEEKRGREAFAIMGSTADRMLRIKPQNLIAGLPLAPDAG
ncbi:MAG: DUF6352 family protein [Proteobacteria bacterium]|nr:DUF6352 family protein [Pseudomonadota bacterium]